MVDLAQVDRGKSRRTVGDGIIRELQNGCLAEADAERAGMVNPVVGEGHDLTRKPGGSKSLLAGRRDHRPIDRQSGAGAGAGEINRDTLAAQVGERALSDRQRRLGRDAVGHGVADARLGQQQVRRGRRRRRFVHGDACLRIANLGRGQGVHLPRIKNEATPVAGTLRRTDAGQPWHEHRPATSHPRRLLLEARDDGRIGAQSAAAYRNGAAEDRRIGARTEGQWSIYIEITVDDIAEETTRPYGLPVQGPRTGGRAGSGAMKDDGIQAVPISGVPTDHRRIR